MPPPKDDKLESLLDEGFSKGRAIQALKDSGRSLEVARRILATQKAHPAAVSKTAACAPVKVLEPASPSALHSPPALPTRVRRHPCIVQYKECFFGDRCLLKDLPGDICIHHYWGKCLHGSSCGNPHYVNGVNLKQIRLNKEHEQREMLATQLHPCIVQHNYCHYGAHCYMMDLPGDICMHHFWGTCSFKSGCRNSHSVDGVDLQQMRVQIEKERSMSYNAVHDNSWENGSRESPQEDLFAFQGRRQHVDPSPTACAEDPAQIGGGGGPSSRPTPFLDAFKALPSSQEAPWQPHRAKDGSREPCASTGELNNPCLNYQQCYFHHERNHGGPLYNDRPTASSTTNPPPYSECVASMPPLLQEQETPTDERDTRDDAAVPEPPSPHVSADCLPSDDVTDDANIGSPATFIDVDAEFNGEWMASEPMLFSGAEMESFSTLCETYPHISPSLVRDTLRSTGGDVHRAAETLHTIFYAAQADGTENDDALAAVLAEEEDKAEEVLQSEKRCSALLNLCYLFPTIEVSVIESVLTRCDGDTSDAYFALFSRHNGITIKSSNRSTSLESLRNANSAHVVSLLQRYPHIAEEVVISVFEATGKNLKLTAEALNQYSTETMSLMKERSMRATGSAPFLMPQLPRPASQLPQGSMVPTEISPDCADACRKAQEEYGDWRSIRRRAYDVNRFRIQMQSRAASSIGSRETQRLLIKEASRLGAEYERLNHLAKLALELERSAGDSSLLDLHGFHTDEILDVVQRRIQTCCKRRVSSLSIVTGEGNHSKNGRPKLFPTLLELLRTDAYLKSKIEKFSAGSGVVKVRIRNS